MADQQITQLPEESGTVGAAFPLAIVNTTAAETRKITTANLATAIAANIGAGGLAASKVGTGYSGASLTDGTVTNAKLVSSSVNFGGVSVALGASDTTPAFNLSDATNYPTSSLTGTITNAQLAGSIANSKLANSAVSFGGISVSLGAADATPAFDLTDATNYKTTNLVGTITNAQLAGSIENAKLSNSSVSFGGISVALGASDATPAFDLQDATGYKTTNLVGTITNAQLAGSIDASKLVANSLTSTQLGANCVGSSELANNAVDTNSVQDGAIVNDKIETSSSSTTGIDGATKLRDGSVTASKLNASTVGNGLAINSNVLSINNTITGATSLGLTFSNQGICTGIAALQASDLSGVLATASAVGVVKVPSSGGLSVSGSGDLSLATTVTAHTTRGIAVNAFGQVTSVSATVPSASLPVASTTAIGGIKVPSTSSPLTVDGNGVLTIGLSGVTAGTGFTKFNVSDKGLITSASGLDASDIPAHSAALLTSGTFDAARIPINSIDGDKLADSAVCQFSGATSTTGVVQFPAGGATTGTFFYDLTNDDLYVYDSNAWQPVTITSGEIIYAGNYRADTNKITSLTAAGTAQGFTVGAALQAASAANNRYYFVCDKSGTGTSPAPTVAINPPDMILSDGTAWQKLDISSFIAGQSAQNISVAPNNGAGGGIHNTNVQSVLEELDTEKLNKTGGTVSGQLLLGNAASLVFEGSSDDGYELTLAVANPQDSDKTLTLPDITGTLITSADTNTVTSTMVDASLANANIAANAAIALSKLAAVSAGQILVGASGTGTITAVTPTGDIALSSAGAFSYVAGSISNEDINGSAGISASKIDAASTSQAGCVQLSSATTSTSATKAATPAAIKICKDAADSAQSTADAALPLSGGTLTNNLIIDNAKQIRFTEADTNGSHFVSLQAPDTLAADTSYTLPSSLPSANGQVLASTTGGVLSWTEDPAGQWVTNGTNIHYDGGNVGINEASPSFTDFGSNTGGLELDNVGSSNTAIKVSHDTTSLYFVADATRGYIGTVSNDEVRFVTNGTLALTLDNSQNATFAGDVDLADSKKIKLGAGNDIQIYHDTTNNLLKAFNVPFRLQTNDSDNAIVVNQNGNVELYYDGVKKLNTFANGVTVTGNLYATDAVYVGDTSDSGSTDYIAVGTGKDLKLYHDGSHSYINDSGTGDLIIESSHIVLKDSGTQVLETTNTGVRLDDNIKLVLGSSSDLEIYHDGSDSYISHGSVGHLFIRTASTDKAIKCVTEGGVQLHWDDSLKFETTSTGAAVTGSLGVGTTTSPLKKLHISDAGDVGIALQTTGANTNKEIWEVTCGANASNEADLIFQSRTDAGSGGIEAMRLASSGKVGIGVSAPTNAKFTVSGGAANSDIAVFTGVDQSRGLKLSTTANGQNDQNVIYNAQGAQGQHIFQCNGSQKFQVQNGGNCNIVDGNLVVASGHGIDFSAVSDGSRSVGSNILDDYEEGTWTPVVTASSGSESWNGGKYGAYTKIGNQVTIRWSLRDYNGNLSGTSIAITGMPFTNNFRQYAGDFGAYYFNPPADTVGKFMFCPASDVILYPYWEKDNLTGTQFQAGELKTGSYLEGNFTFKVA